MSKGKKGAKKVFQKKIVEQLNSALPDLKERIGAKKFKRRIEKASRIIFQGIKLTSAEKSVKKETINKMKDLGVDKKVASAYLSGNQEEAK